MRILLIAGGWSSEREVSLSGAKKIRLSLENLGHAVHFLDPALAFDDIAAEAARADFAFINLHGAPGEDGLIQALLDAVRLPYQGTGPAGSFLALSKAAAKQIYRARGLATPPWEFLPKPPGEAFVPRFPPPYFVKPNLGGSSVLAGLAPDREALAAMLAPIFQSGDAAIVEPALCGTELTCAVLGETPLPPILIRPKSGSGFFDYAAKYAQDGADELCPAPVPPEITHALEQTALAAHRALGLCGCSRSDFILSGSDLFLLETNTLPGMTPTSLLPRAAAAAGMSFEDLLARLIELGLARGRHAHDRGPA
ncbi:MAG: D-alanine--D-alanine ligase [Desulfovibrionaceae bacterium]|nr:D-alanine--D-alanine ligase [Desulfovibrionaceae bacterium]